MKKNPYHNSILLKLSFMLLTLMLLVGLAYVVITAYAARNYFLETTQRLNAQVAEHLVKEVPPFNNGVVNEEALGKIMHSMMAVNPALEVYLLDSAGTILSYVVLDKKVKLKSVDVQPVKKFIADSGQFFLEGDDPRNPGKKVVFSSAPVVENNALLGYVYIVLQSEEYENVTDALVGSYFLRVGTFSFGLTLVVAFALGLLLIFILTRSIRKIQSGVKAFEDGEYQARIPVNGNDEMAQLAVSINSMADTILRNIEDLKQVDSLRRELIANVSHDLRSPMTVIHGFVETYLMKKDSLSQEEQKQYLEAILFNSEKLRKLVADLFELSKLEAKQVVLHKEPFMMNELLSEMCTQFALLATQKEIKLESKIPQKMPPLLADLDLLSRALHNLFDNAMKYTQQNGLVKLIANVNGNNLEISLSNSGEGIREEELPHVFDRYYKATNSGNAHQSTGLGLAIAQKIMHLHNGSIRVLSKPGVDTTFLLSIPLRD
ncbi:MAG: HAMP domain-containing sensor histidine kinase [Flavobacteriales bacterium]|nr:HAMP domain-containing sensor histidine kinase [Flavobacteriales bacterium]